MGPFTAPYKTGFVNHQAPKRVETPKCLEYAFKWADGNIDDEDRTGYGVSLLEGELVKGGKCIIGVTTRTDELDPSIQWVAVAGFVDVVTSRIRGDTGWFSNNGVFKTSKNPESGGNGRRGFRTETLIPPILAPYMYVWKKTKKNGKCTVLLM
jgi:hypothetical protein